MPPVAPFGSQESAYVGVTLGRRGVAATTPTTAAARAFGSIRAVWQATSSDDASLEVASSGCAPTSGTASRVIEAGAHADAAPADAVLLLFTNLTPPSSSHTSADIVRTTVRGVNMVRVDWGRPSETSSCSINATRSSDAAAAAATARLDEDKWAGRRQRRGDNAQAARSAPTDETASSNCRGDVALAVVGNTGVPIAS